MSWEVSGLASIEEPEVEKVPLPQREPECRVGIVLREDNKSNIQIELPPGRFRLTANGTESFLEGKSVRTLGISSAGNEVICRDMPECSFAEASAHYKGSALKSGGMVSVEPVDAQEVLAPKSGILMRGVVAGRGFHWQKEVDLHYPRRLEFFARDGCLIAVNVLPLEAYLACLVTSEMSGACPSEFIKAQATAARTWMMVFLKNKHVGEPFSICNDDCCQRYQGTTFLSDSVAGSVERSRGMFLVTHEGYLCPAYYSKNCGGIMERAQNIFGQGAVGISEETDAPSGSVTELFNPVTGENIREWVTGEFLSASDSFCSPKVCPEETLAKYLGAVDVAGHYYRWRLEYSRESLEHLLRTKGALADLGEFVDFRSIKRGNSGRIHDLEVIYKDTAGGTKSHIIHSQYEIRRVLHEKFLFSSAFIWEQKRDTRGRLEGIALTGAGWGHGVGLCQIGALGMALQGYPYEEILKHYYDGCQLLRAYE